MRMIRNRNYSNESRPGYVLTPQRKIILETIKQNGGLLDARQLYKLVNRKDETISLATVYRTLNLLVQAGLIDRRNLEGKGCCFELKQSPEHQHLYCLKCGRIINFISPAISSVIEQIQREEAFRVEKIEVCIKGTCRECQTEEEHEK